MKSRYSDHKTVIITIAVLFGCLFFHGCKKEHSNDDSDSDRSSTSSRSSDRYYRNLPPRARAGADQTVTTHSSNLDGSASSDDDGDIVSYQWVKETGPAATIESATSARTGISGLASNGSYRFRLTVTDNNGATGSDTIHITVNAGDDDDGDPSNQPPAANAGPDKTITLPVNSVLLHGAASDPDGSVVSFQWTKVNGNGGNITSPATATTTIAGLIAGNYTYRLTVTDNDGATGTDTVHITVNGDDIVDTPNQPPVVSADGNRTITLPLNTVTLTGTANDPDGDVISYRWTKISGNNSVIVSPYTLVTVVTGLTAGSYIFRLTVTDDDDATGTDTIHITVLAPTPSGGGGGSPTPANYTLTYSNGYDDESDINSNQLGRGGISTSIYNIGPGSFRSEVRAGDPPISSGWRSEQQYNGSTYNPDEGAIEYDVYYEDWDGFDGGGHSIQWHPMTGGGSAIVSLQNYQGKFDVVRDPDGTVYHQQGTLRTCESNRWYHLRWEFRWSTGSNGYVRLYIDNELYYSYNGETADGSGQYLKVGQNRWPSGGGNMQTTSVCYYDNLRIYRKN